MTTEAHDIRKEINKYYLIFAGLLVLTVITVLVSNIQWGIMVGVAVALIIASIKGALVACHFMHLRSEKRLIYLVLILTIVFFLAMMFLIYIAHFNLPQGAQYVS